MVIVTEHTADEREATLTKIKTLRLIADDPSVEIVEMPGGQCTITGAFYFAIKSGDSAFQAHVLAAMAPKPDNITHTSWHAYTHRRGLPKFTVHLDSDAYDALYRLADDVNDSEDVDKAVCEALAGFVALCLPPEE